MQIEIEKKTDDQLIAIGVFSWPVWSKEVSTFEWTYEDVERAYFLDGEVEVEAYGERYSFGKGDFVTFPVGMTCIWHVKKPVRKHYQLG
jgi:uncharacterized cupin superfamily protein